MMRSVLAGPRRVDALACLLLALEAFACLLSLAAMAAWALWLKVRGG